MELLSTGDAGKLLDCSTENVRALERRGKLSPMRTSGGQRIFDRAEVEKLAREREQNAMTRHSAA